MSDFSWKNLSPEEKAQINSKPGYNYNLKLPGLLRMVVAIALFAVELFFLNWPAFRLTALGLDILGGLQLAALVFAIYLSQKVNRTSYTIFWIMIILFFPALGLILYLFWGNENRFGRQRLHFAESQARLAPWRKSEEASKEELAAQSLDLPGQIQLRYLLNKGFPIYKDTKMTYAPTGEDQFEQMFKDIAQAKDFIFLEYFIISDGYIWEQTVDLLLEKADEGLEIRLLYDDFGTTARACSNTMVKLKEHGVKIINFNPVARYISGLYRNYRNHQKAAIIDGKIAWLGGTNLADEYANIHKRFGYWKDTAIRLEGPACDSITTDFLLMWEHDGIYPLDEDYSHFLPQQKNPLPPLADSGLVVPFWDGPLGREDHPASDLISSLISTAEKRLYICTPYLVPETDMVNRIIQAAQSGVEVFILMPGIPDKKLVYKVSQSNYYHLLKAGCRIFLYEPGFLHAKTFLADGERALVGSINLDYRSLYLNFENGVYIYQNPVLQDIEADMEEIISHSREIDLASWEKRPFRHKFLEFILKPLSPLL